MQKRNRIARVSESLIPTPDEAVTGFERTGGQVTLFPKFGADPLQHCPDLQEAIESMDLQNISLSLNQFFPVL